MYLDIYQDLLKHKPIHWKALCLYAFVGGTVYSEDLEEWMRRNNLSASRMKSIQQELCSRNHLCIGDYDWQSCQFCYKITPEHYLPVTYLLFTKHPDWVKEFTKLCLDCETMYRDLQTIVLQGMKGKFNDIPGKWFTSDMLPYLLPIITTPELIKIAIRMPETMFLSFFKLAITFMSENDIVDSTGTLPSLLTEAKKLLKDTNRKDLQEMLALYRYYSHGEYSPTAKPCTMYTLILEAVHAAHHKQYEQAYIYFDSAMKIQNLFSYEKNMLYGMLNSYFLVMTYIHMGSKGETKLQQLLKKKPMRTENSFLPAFTIGCCFSDAEWRLSPNLAERLLNHNAPTARLFGFLFAKYRGMGLEQLSSEDFIPNQAVMRHELSTFLPMSDEEKKKLTELYGDAPLLTSIHSKQGWELVLEKLAAELDTAQAQTEKSTRLGYFINYGNRVDVREQSRLKSGAWGCGKIVSSSRYASGNIECMDETDRNIWNNYRRKGGYQLYLEEVLPELVGSDRIYTGHRAPYEPVSVTLEKPYIVVEKGKGVINISANYPPIHSQDRYESSTHIIVKKSDTRYVVIPLKGKQRHYYEQLLTLKKLPMEAEERLQTFFPKIKDVVEVYSSSMQDSCNLESIEGSAAICLQAHPHESWFHIDFFAKPLPEGKALFLPGQGTVLAIDEKDGKRCQLKRHLQQERKNYEDIVSYLEEATDKTVYESGVELTPEEMLSLLDYIRPLTDHYFIEWPEGESLRLKGTVPPAKWNVDLKSENGWFDIEGEVSLDDDSVLSMAQLLELIGQSKGKYVRLNDTDYLRLSDNLRKQLSRLESIAVKSHGKMQISNLQAGLLGQDVLNGELEINYDDSLAQMRQRIADSKSLKVKVPAKLKATLRDYQLDGFQWIARLNSWGAGACLADDMGLGKTVQAIAYLLLMAKKGASLIVAPASVVSNWRKELERFAPSLHVSLLNDATDRQKTIRKAKASDVVLSTYGLLVSESDCLTEKHWNVICLDEAHTIKNRETKTSACVMKLQADNRLILTGTPVQNHLGELWNLFRFINPGLLGTYEQFQQKFITPIEQNSDKQRQLQLNRIVHPFMLRRTKKEVVEELPDKQEITLPVELSEEEMGIYEVIRRKAQKMVTEGGAKVNVAALSEITKLRQAACCASLVEKKWKGECSKINRLIDLMNELKDGGNRALIFSQFTSFFKLIRQELDKAGEEYLYLDGSIPVKQREKLVQEFQEGNCPFFLISLKAGGLGLNLTGANYIIHLDPWWNPAIEQQATDRAYRIGQEQKVTAYHLVSTHTIEEKIIRLHETKRNLSDALLSGTDMSHKLTAQDLMEILEE